MPTSIDTQDHEYGTSFFIHERIFLGEGLFETLRVIDGKPCYSKLHWQRLQRSALFLQLPFELSFIAWHEKLTRNIASAPLQEGGIKAILGAGSAPRGLLVNSKESRLVFDMFSYQPTNRTVKLDSASWLRDGKNPIYQFKSINYLEAIIACRQVQQRGADDVLFFNLEQHATETSIANLFIIKNNQLFTPSLRSGVLAGIIRQRLLWLCKENNIPCFECDLDKTSLMQADSVFVCNALQGIKPVSAFDRVDLNTDHRLITQLQAILAYDQQESVLT